MNQWFFIEATIGFDMLYLLYMLQDLDLVMNQICPLMVEETWALLHGLDFSGMDEIARTKPQ